MRRVALGHVLRQLLGEIPKRYQQFHIASVRFDPLHHIVRRPGASEVASPKAG
jgi:hypothetical protein